MLAVEIARYVLGRSRAHELPQIAQDAFEEGFTSPSLAALALSAPSSSFERDRLFERALRELNMPLPDKETAAWCLIREAASRILSRDTTPFAGALEISTLSHHLRDNSAVHTFIYVADEHERVDLSTAVRAEWAVEIVAAARQIAAKPAV